jgi:hypothetical protein
LFEQVNLAAISFHASSTNAAVGSLKSDGGTGIAIGSSFFSITINLPSNLREGGRMFLAGDLLKGSD